MAVRPTAPRTDRRRPGYHAAVTADLVAPRSVPERLAALATAMAASIVVIAIAILPFLTPAWVAFEQGRTNASALSGYAEPDLRTATNSILHDLVVGPPAFDVQIDRGPVLEERERAHMRDVRGVFAGFGVLALVSVVGLVVLVVGARRMGHPERAWAAISTGMHWLIGGIIVAGVLATFAFDALFEVFHRIFFPGGTYTFDPRTDHLVQLFPFDFWSETTIVLGGVIAVLAALISVVTGRLARRVRRAHEAVDAGPISAATAEAAR